MNDRFHEVRAAIGAGDPATAQRLLNQALERNSYDGEAWYLLSTITPDPAQRADYLSRAQAAGYAPPPGYGQPGYAQPAQPRPVDSWVQPAGTKISSNLVPLLIIGGIFLVLVAGGIFLFSQNSTGGGTTTASLATEKPAATARPTQRPTATAARNTAGEPGGIQPIEGDPAVIGEFFPNEGQNHTADGRDVTYGTEPPTSGTHWGRWSDWGDFSSTIVPDEMLVHNLEHGGVIIYFNPERVRPDEKQQLIGLVSELSLINPRVILTQRPTMDTPIALTSWQYRLLLDTVDLDKIRGFYNAHIARGPECIDGRCP